MKNKIAVKKIRKIKNDKELFAILDGQFIIPIYWQEEDVDNSRVRVDEESMREEFEDKLQELVEMVDNY